jgi:hypothetical protein
MSLCVSRCCSQQKHEVQLSPTSFQRRTYVFGGDADRAPSETLDFWAVEVSFIALDCSTIPVLLEYDFLEH